MAFALAAAKADGGFRHLVAKGAFHYEDGVRVPFLARQPEGGDAAEHVRDVLRGTDAG